MTQMPALSLIAVPGRRKKTLELASEIEKRGFSGIYCPSYGDPMALCQAIGEVTNSIEFGTTIQPIYMRNPVDLAQSAAFIHEMSGGRFRLGIGVSHTPMLEMMGIKAGKPLSDMRDYVGAMESVVSRAGELPPITLATLRDKMLGLSVEISQGAVWANGARSHMKVQLEAVPQDKKSGDFFIGDMIPTTISDDTDAAAAINRRTLMGYVQMPNYRNYWKAAGYVEEMEAIEAAITVKDKDKIASSMSDKWLSDVTLYGTASKVREGVEAWFDAGVKTPILVPSAVKGGQMQAFADIFAAFA